MIGTRGQKGQPNRHAAGLVSCGLARSKRSPTLRSKLAVGLSLFDTDRTSIVEPPAMRAVAVVGGVARLFRPEVAYFTESRSITKTRVSFG